MREPIIVMEDVTKRFPGIVALDRVTLTIQPGEWMAIMGASGSGKSTLLNLIGCLDRPTSGRIAVAGVDLGRLAEAQLSQLRREKLGLVFQHFHMVPYLTAVENVMLAQYFHSMTDENEARAALEAVGLGERLYHLPAQLSGGEQQRVCIARALINQPRLILADEPTGNLDGANEEIVLNIFHTLHAQGHTLIVVTHDARVARMADRLIVLEHGLLLRIELNRSNQSHERPAF